MENVQIEGLSFKPFIKDDRLQAAIKKMAVEINDHYKDKHLHLVVVLKGAFIFAADLIREINIKHTVHFVKFSSYEGTKSTGNIREEFSLKLNPKDNHILIVEDIVDTGTTLQYFINKIETESPASVHIASLLVKPAAMKFDLYIKFSGFDIENNFVVGYGLDYNDHGRNLKHIYQLND
jgi:hypoxanthine phosphoribosyltransferase